MNDFLRSSLRIDRSFIAAMFAGVALGVAGCANTDTEATDAATSRQTSAAMPGAPHCAQLSGGEREECERQGHEQDPPTEAAAQRQEQQAAEDAAADADVNTSDAESQVDTAGAAPTSNSRIRQATRDRTAPDPTESNATTDEVDANEEQEDDEQQAEDTQEAVDTLGGP